MTRDQNPSFPSPPTISETDLAAAAAALHISEDRLRALGAPEQCRVLHHRDLSCTFVTDLDTDADLIGHGLIYDFMFYRPLPHDITYALCVYGWTMSEHCMVLDGARKTAVHSVHHFYGNGREPEWEKLDAYRREADGMRAMMRPQDDGIAWYRVGFGKSCIFQNTDDRQGRLVSDPASSRVYPLWVYQSIIRHLYTQYILGMPPLNPELMTFDENAQTVHHVNGARVALYRYDADPFAPMNPSRQSLFDTFAALHAKPDSALRQEMRGVFLELAGKMREQADNVVSRIRQAVEEGKLTSAPPDVAEQCHARLEANPEQLFEAFFPLTLMYRPTVVNRDVPLTHWADPVPAAAGSTAPALASSGKPKSLFRSIFDSIVSRKRHSRETDSVEETGSGKEDGGPSAALRALYRAMREQDAATVERFIDFASWSREAMSRIANLPGAPNSSVGLTEGMVESFKEGFLADITNGDPALSANFDPKNYTIVGERIDGDHAEVTVRRYNAYNGQIQRVVETLHKYGDEWKSVKPASVSE